MSASAHSVVQTYDCKTPHCDGEARSRVGRYSYCDYCREQRQKAAAAESYKPTDKAAAGRFKAGVAELNKLAARADKLRTQAAQKTQAALAAKQAADAAEADFRAAVRRLGNNE